ncbi:class I SAM-dependent methyltransferase [Candidatus Parcubacteria bacterium]|nr:class I SAM-dependent methyltransferase [Patescibacteria group bacterium]MCG2699672.1 class I SAM-dependent methyltransferase [Candidatus Parcubacteria bacterium]
MSNKRYDNFVKWNNEMIKKFDLEHYHDNFNFVIRFIEHKRVECILSFLKINKKDIVIEIGCGVGDILNKINSNKLIGVDISQYILNIAKKRYKNIRFINGNAENLPIKISRNKYDKIICSEVLEHVENPVKVLKEIKKISKNNSIIVISAPNEKLINRIKVVLQRMKIFNFLFPNISKKMDDEWHLHSFDLKKIKNLIFDDYTIEKVRGIPYNFIPIRYVFKLKLKIND